jgi:YVTN family beta-propeller protein
MFGQHVSGFFSPKDFFQKAISLSFAALFLALAGGCAGVAPMNVAMPVTSPSPSPAATSNATTFVYVTESELGVGNLITLNTKDQTMARLPIAGAPAAVAVSPDGRRAYVADQASNSVIVVDTQNSTIVTHIPVGNLPWRIAASPDGRSVYVTNINDGTLSLIDTATNIQTNTIFTDSSPAAVAFSPDGRKAYVTLLDIASLTGGPNHVNALLVIDTSTQQIIKQLPLVTGVEMVVSPTRHELYLVIGGSFSVVNTDTDELLAQVALDNDQTTGVAVSPDGSRIYVTEHGMIDIGHTDPPDPIIPAKVYVISADTRAPIAKAETAPGLTGISLSPDGGTAYLVSDGTSVAGMQTFNTTTLIFGALQTLGGEPNGLAISRH